MKAVAQVPSLLRNTAKLALDHGCIPIPESRSIPSIEENGGWKQSGIYGRLQGSENYKIHKDPSQCIPRARQRRGSSILYFC